MNWDKVEGNWTEFKGKMREAWGDLTDDELEAARGRGEQLVGVIQQRYGESRDEVERRIESLQRSL